MAICLERRLVSLGQKSGRVFAPARHACGLTAERQRTFLCFHRVIARKQPTVADAVKRVLADQNRDSSPTALVPGVTTRDITVSGAAGLLPATVYTPAGTAPFPVVLYLLKAT